MISAGVERVFHSLALLALLSSCDSSTGPSDDGPIRLDVPVTGESLQATTTNPNLCCCRAIGTVQNRSAVPVHVTLTYGAFRTGVPDSVGSAVAFLFNVQPGEQRRFSASGFLIPCASINRLVLTDKNLRGVYFPDGLE